MSKPRLTLGDICRAYAEGTINGGIGQSLRQLRYSPRTIDAMLKEAITARLIAHSGDQLGGWLTEAGVQRLDPETQARYRRALSRRGTFLGSG